MGGAPSACIAPSEMEIGAVLLANMREAWVDDEANLRTTGESVDERQNHATASEQARLCVCAPIDHGTGSSQSGEHGTSVCSPPESAGAGVERSDDPHARPGSRSIVFVRASPNLMRR